MSTKSDHNSRILYTHLPILDETFRCDCLKNFHIIICGDFEGDTMVINSKNKQLQQLQELQESQELNQSIFKAVLEESIKRSLDNEDIKTNSIKTFVWCNGVFGQGRHINLEHDKGGHKQHEKQEKMEYTKRSETMFPFPKKSRFNIAAMTSFSSSSICSQNKDVIFELLDNCPNVSLFVYRFDENKHYHYFEAYPLFWLIGSLFCFVGKSEEIIRELYEGPKQILRFSYTGQGGIVDMLYQEGENATFSSLGLATIPME